MRIGVDMGGTKIEAIALDDDGRECARRRIATPAGDYQATVTAVAGLVADIRETVGPVPGIGVGIPGTISPATGLVKNANSTCLIGHPLDRDLEAALGCPVVLANDANCFVMSEAADGAAAGADVVFGVILGTGVGGGIIVRGRSMGGPNAIAGEWGHNPLPWPNDADRPGPTCYCGLQGCIETFVSGTGFARDYGGGVAAPEIIAQAEAGEHAAMQALERYEDRLARCLASVINVLDPDVIVLGGGMSNVERLYETVPRLWGQWVFSDVTATPLRRNVHGDSSGVRGAAWLWDQKNGRKQ
jgi:fructokinase